MPVCLTTIVVCKSGKRVVADLGILARLLRLLFGRFAGKRLDQIGAGNDADQPALVHNRHALDRVLLEHERDVGDRRIGLGSDDVARHQLGDFLPVRLDVIGSERAVGG